MFSCASEDEASSSTPFHAVFGFLIMLLLTLVGVHFQGLNMSPLTTHYAAMVLFIIAVFIYSIAFAGIKVGPHNTSYLPIFNFICLTSGIIACELLVYILIPTFWLLIINLCATLVEVLRRWYKQISARLIDDLVLDTSSHLLQKIHQSASKAFAGFTLTHCSTEKEEDKSFQNAEIV